MKHGSDAEVIPLCGPHWFTYGCHVDHDQSKGQFRLMTREQRQRWDADQVALHRAWWEVEQIVSRTRVVPF